METADSLPATRRREREIHYRDGLIIAILSLWPIRRRSLAAPTLDRHVEVADDCINLCLFPADTKAQRAESWSVPELLLPFLERYLAEIRPGLLGRKSHDALWVGRRGDPLQAGGIYAAVRRRTAAAFGKLMALHDFRRAAATFLAITAPEQVGLIPGILQHASPEVSDRYYNLSRGAMASRRYNAAVAELKARMSQSMR
jgi:integrase